MLGHKSRFISINERFESRQMRPVQSLRPPYRHADAVQRHGIVAPDRCESMMRRPAGAHVIFDVDLEEATLRTFREDRRQVLMFEARAGKLLDRMRRKAKSRYRGR